MLNFLIPILSWSFIWTDNSNALNECLGKGYLKFLSIKGHYCTEDNILCWAWLFLVIILISNIIDVYCIYQCIKDIKKSTEKTRNMLSKQAYTNRKRFDNPHLACADFKIKVKQIAHSTVHFDWWNPLISKM